MFVVMVFYCVLLFLGGNFQKSLLKIMIQNYFNPVPSLFSTVGIVGGPTLIKSPHEYSSTSLNCCLTSVHHSVPNQSLDILGINESINHVARIQAHSQLQSSCCRHSNETSLDLVNTMRQDRDQAELS